MLQTIPTATAFQPFGTTTTSFGGLTCISGQVRLFRFFTVPRAGEVIGNITPFFGSPIPIIQTQPTPLGGISLSSVDGQIAVLCGQFVQRGGQVVFDVRVVNPGFPSPTGTPGTQINPQLLLLLLFLSLLGGFGIGGTAGIGGLGGLGSLGLGNIGGISGLGQQGF